MKFDESYKEYKLPEINKTMGYIYYLFYKNELVYIGQTIDLPNRISSHICSDKVFDKVLYKDCPTETLTTTEIEEIKKHKPILNGSGLEREYKYSDELPMFKVIDNYCFIRGFGASNLKDTIITEDYIIFSELKSRDKDKAINRLRTKIYVYILDIKERRLHYRYESTVPVCIPNSTYEILYCPINQGVFIRRTTDEVTEDRWIYGVKDLPKFKVPVYL